MFAVIVNAVTSSLGALLGFFLKRGIPERFTKAIFGVISLCVAIMGIQGAVQSQNLLLVLASMIIGTLVGTLIGIEDGMNRFGEFLKKRMGRGDDSRFVRGFVTLSIMQVIGAMAIIGVILAFPAAFIARRIGLKNTVLVSLACLAIGSAIGAIAGSIPMLMVSRLIEGIGIGLIGVAAPTCVSVCTMLTAGKRKKFSVEFG